VVEIIYYIAASLDGYIAPLDRGLSWLAPFESSAEDYGYADFYRSIDAVLVGSQTFQQASQFPQWPYPEKLCWVFSRRPCVSPSRTPLWPTRAPGRWWWSWAVGGGQLAGSFRAQGLIRLSAPLTC